MFLRETLELLQPTVKPTDVIQQQAGANGAPAAGQQQTYPTLSLVIGHDPSCHIFVSYSHNLWMIVFADYFFFRYLGLMPKL